MSQPAISRMSVDITDEKLFRFWNSLPHGYRKAIITNIMSMVMNACEKGNKEIVIAAITVGCFDLVPTLEKKNAPT